MNDILSVLAAMNHIIDTLGRYPGRPPQDKIIASDLLMYCIGSLRGHPSRLLIRTLEVHGARPDEAAALAKALASLSLRLGAYLGREAT